MSEPMHIIFLCTGNTCRSPMAEGIARKIFAEAGLPIVVESYGTLDMPGNPPAPEAIAICDEHGIDIAGHRAQKLTENAAERADAILVMEHEHNEWICDDVGAGVAHKAYLLTDYLAPAPSGKEIPDPIGESESVYRGIFQMLWDEIMRIAKVEKQQAGG